ncbi:histidine phosphatase family protein [Anaerocolumna xylanovorans]|uniref:Alpha-ribazole phosphatase n=1 Tax=Anaerocolumna xylanovorans DSM 12503 TaxID=1121345 RepID=A0A1M7XYU7_9FIRM|nr:histidine phosphatase family protein [Anaerocolumna xylanovorans]SHO44197.1 alpha-ribazole phosphatase [Anaerocolumna xylanovorans DSM 12503]
MRNWTENQINLILIRHGETPSNTLKRYLGKTDEDLSEAGIEKLLLEKEKGKYPKADILFSSPMKRCIQTAEILYGCKKPVIIEEWREIDFGRFEGKNYKELNGDADYQAWIDSNGELPFPEGESREEFLQRCQKGLQKAVAGLVREERETPVTAAAVVHGGNIMALLSACHGGNYYDYQCKNAEGYMCSLKFLNKSELSIEIIRKL